MRLASLQAVRPVPQPGRLSFPIDLRTQTIGNANQQMPARQALSKPTDACPTGTVTVFLEGMRHHIPARQVVSTHPPRSISNQTPDRPRTSKRLADRRVRATKSEIRAESVARIIPGDIDLRAIATGLQWTNEILGIDLVKKIRIHISAPKDSKEQLERATDKYRLSPHGLFDE
jgi:hypothetical protein